MMKLKDLVRGIRAQKADVSVALALAILLDRIRSLNSEDRKDLFELLKELPNAKSEEERESIFFAFAEILEKTPGQILQEDLVAQDQPSSGLQKWMDFVGEKIRSLRIQAGMKQEELAEKSGIPQSHISRIEGRKLSPTRKTLEKIAAALQVPLGELDPSA